VPWLKGVKTSCTLISFLPQLAQNLAVYQH
jgi:hypothetical protein